MKVSLKSTSDIDIGVRKLTPVIQESCWKSTPEDCNRHPQSKTYSDCIRQMILEKKRLRRVWHNSRHTDHKRKLNKEARHLNILINEANDSEMDSYLGGLTGTKATNYSLWEASKNQDRPL